MFSGETKAGRGNHCAGSLTQAEMTGGKDYLPLSVCMCVENEFWQSEIHLVCIFTCMRRLKINTFLRNQKRLIWQIQFGMDANYTSFRLFSF